MKNLVTLLNVPHESRENYGKRLDYYWLAVYDGCLLIGQDEAEDQLHGGRHPHRRHGRGQQLPARPLPQLRRSSPSVIPAPPPSTPLSAPHIHSTEGVVSNPRLQEENLRVCICMFLPSGREAKFLLSGKKLFFFYL